MNRHLWLSSIFLILVNLIPLFGVFFFEWGVFTLLLLYWVESLVMGVFTIFKILKARGKQGVTVLINNQPAKDMPNGELAGSFAYAYGMFMAVHLVFLVFFYSLFFKGESLHIFSLALVSLSIFLSHYFSYKTNFIGNEEFRSFAPTYVFYAPFKRIFVMQFIIILGIGFFVGMFHMPPQTLIFPIVLFKTLGDLWFHSIEHSGKSRSMPVRIRFK